MIKKHRTNQMIRTNRRNAYCFLLPNLIGFILFTFIPVISAFVLSFMEWDGANTATFIGLNNFKQLFNDSTFIISFGNTIYYSFVTVPLTIVASLMLAVLLNKGIKGLKFFRALHFFPHIASIVAVAVVWQFLYNPDLGPINMFLKTLGFNNPPRWTASVDWAMPAVILMSVWKSSGYYMVMFLAGLQGIPNNLYEVADIDGASAFKKFWYITLPMLSPTMFFVVIVCLINSFKVFTQIYIMTEGGPGRATSVLVYTIYNQAFLNFKFGYASAMALVLFAMVFIISVIQFKVQEKWVNYVN